MKRFSEQLNKKANGIKLTAAERADLRDRVVSYMEYHPLPKDLKSTSKPAALISEPFKILKINYAQLSSLAGVFTVVIMVIVPVIAERAVPGDVLYPVKVQFNEEVRSTLAFSPYAKVEWETERLERRLAEARLLADEGKLTEEMQAEVVLAVQGHSEAAKKEIEAIRASDSDEAVIAEIAFASVLEVQSEVLESREGSAGEAGRSVLALAGVVAEARSGMQASQEASNPAYDKLLARMEMETTYAQELFASIQDGVSPEQAEDIGRRFEDIQRKITAATELHGQLIATAQASSTSTEVREKRTQSPEQEAKTLLKGALADTRKLISFMTDIDVRNSVTVNDLVPVTLTAEEMRAAVTLRLQSLEASTNQLQFLAPSEEFADKFTIGKEKLTSIVSSAVAAQAENNFDAVSELVTEGELILTDLMQMGTLTEVVPDNLATSTDPEASVEGAASSTEAEVE